MCGMLEERLGPDFTRYSTSSLHVHVERVQSPECVDGAWDVVLVPTLD